MVLHLQELFPFCFLPSSMKTLLLNWLIPSTKREVYESFVKAAQVQFEVWMVKLYVLHSEKKNHKKQNNKKGTSTIKIIIIITFIIIHSIKICISDWLKSHR